VIERVEGGRQPLLVRASFDMDRDDGQPRRSVLIRDVATYRTLRIPTWLFAFLGYFFAALCFYYAGRLSKRNKFRNSFGYDSSNVKPSPPIFAEDEDDEEEEDHYDFDYNWSISCPAKITARLLVGAALILIIQGSIAICYAYRKKSLRSFIIKIILLVSCILIFGNVLYYTDYSCAGIYKYSRVCNDMCMVRSEIKGDLRTFSGTVIVMLTVNLVADILLARMIKKYHSDTILTGSFHTPSRYVPVQL
jgi:hypothetical protein